MEPEKQALLLLLLQWEKILGTILCLLVIWALSKGIRSSTERLIYSWKKKRLPLLRWRTVLIFSLYILGFLFIVKGVWGVTGNSAVVLGASLFLALAFVFKDLAGSMIAGLILVFDGPFQAGDRVQFHGIYGDIKSIGMRATRLVTLDDTLVTIPNQLFLNEATFCGNVGLLEMMVVVDFYAALDADLASAMRLVGEAVQQSSFVDPQKPVTLLTKEIVLGPVLAYQIKAKAYVKEFLEEKKFETDLTVKVHKLFKENKIARPYDALLVKSA